MNDRNVNEAPEYKPILYKHFFVFINLPYVSNFIRLFLKYLVKKFKNLLQIAAFVSFFYRLLNAKFSNILYFTWTLFEKHLVYYLLL